MARTWTRGRPKVPNVHRAALNERWKSILRGQLLLEGVKAPELVEEHKFHPTRKFLFDFALPDLRIGIEVEGGTWIHNPRPGYKGRHNSGAGYERDCEKYSIAAIEGWMVVRATSTMVQSGRGLDLVLQAIAARKASERG